MENKDIDLTLILKKRMMSYPRKRGRYNSSELYGINHGFITPETWMNPKEREPEELLKMWNGILVHDHIQRLLPGDTNEIKVEHYFNGIVLVGKADNIPMGLDEVWELKTSDEAMESSKPSHDYQARLYCSIFKKKKGVVFQPVQNEKGLFLKRIGEVERDDIWFEHELKRLFNFHLEVEKLWELKQK